MEGICGPHQADPKAWALTTYTQTKDVRAHPKAHQNALAIICQVHPPHLRSQKSIKATHCFVMFCSTSIVQLGFLWQVAGKMNAKPVKCSGPGTPDV